VERRVSKVPIVIDGWNFIRDRSSRIDDDLEEFQSTHNDPIVLVFDSKYEYLEISYRNTPKLKVVPARDADDYIKRYIDEVPERQRRNLRVVSTDNEVYYYAKSSYATPLKCREFWDKLCGSLYDTDDEEDDEG
jgi:predicted RNA-binding protein with PIN domain